MSASHIVGGEVNYKYIGANNYEIRLTIYRDCFNGQAPFDDPATVGIFDNAGGLIQELSLFFDVATPLENNIDLTCGDLPTNVCVEKFTYVGNANLPPRSGGYKIEYQRCCRNYTILNIASPNNTGATFYATIPDATINGNNSNPVITNFPPIFLCNGVPFEFDNSAIDADGDYLVYQLCTPFDGASSANPRPYANQFTAINPIIWGSGFSASNMLGGTNSLAINSTTGLLTCTPTTTGQFVAGICVLEYRNGVLLGETKRDFQLNVVNCNLSIITAITVASTTCSQTVNFQNNSTGATSFYWDFGDTGNPGDTSSAVNPTYTYPSPGTFNVMFIAANSICTDTVIKTITINDYPIVNLGNDTTLCRSVSINLNTGNPYSSHLWSTGAITPNIQVTNSGTYWVKVGNGNCYSYDTIIIAIHPINVNLGSDTTLCNQAVYTISTGNAGNTYLWSTGVTSQGIVISASGSYWVSVSNSYCIVKDTVQVNFSNSPPLDLGPDKQVCEGEQTTLNTGNIGNSYLWSNGNTSQSITVSAPGIYTVTVYKDGCYSTDAINITNNEIVNLGDDKSLCDLPEVTIDAGNLGTAYLWSTGQTTQKIVVQEAGQYWVVMKLDNCISSDTINIIGSQNITLYIPNSFTPNNDLLNEELKAFGYGINKFTMRVYSQWGEELFSTNDINEGWKGFYKDKKTIMPLGVYAYVIEYSTLCSGEKEYRIYGHILLLR